MLSQELMRGSSKLSAHCHVRGACPKSSSVRSPGQSIAVTPMADASALQDFVTRPLTTDFSLSLSSAHLGFTFGIVTLRNAQRAAHIFLIACALCALKAGTKGLVVAIATEPGGRNRNFTYDAPPSGQPEDLEKWTLTEVLDAEPGRVSPVHAVRMLFFACPAAPCQRWLGHLDVHWLAVI